MTIVRWARVGGATATLLLATFAPAGTADAQSSSDDRPARSSTSVSPIDGQGFRIGASLRTYYDSNIIRLGDGFSQSDTRSKGDFRFTPSVDLAVGQPVGRQQLFIGAQVGRDFYAKNSRLDRNRYSIGGGAILRAGRSCTGSITGEYKRRQSLLSESSGRGDNTQEVIDYGAAADCAPVSGIGLGGSVNRQMTNNQNIERSIQDSRETNLEGHLNFGAPLIGTFTAGGSLSRFDYPNRDLFVAGPDGNLLTTSDKLDLYSAHVGFSRAVGTRLSVSAQGSYVKVKPKPENVINLIQDDNGITFPILSPRAGYSGPGYNLSIDYHTGVRLSASLSGGRNITSSPNVAARLDIHDDIGLVVNYKLGAAISTSIGANYDRRQYRGGFATVADPIARTRDSIKRVFAQATYAPRPLYGIDFEVGHQKRTSNPSQYNFSSTSASVTLRVKFGRG